MKPLNTVVMARGGRYRREPPDLKIIFTTMGYPMIDIAYTQFSGRSGRPQQDAIWNGKAALQAKDIPSTSYVAHPVSIMLAVADGVSASRSPALASRFVIDAVANATADAPLTGKSVRRAHEALCNKYAHGAMRGSSTTLVAARLVNTTCEIVNVGDSRAYLISANGEWVQLSHDHTILNELIASGEVTVDEGVEYARIYQGLAHCLTADHEEYGFSVHYRKVTLRQGDGLLLCSDGLHDAVGEDYLRQLYCGDRSPKEQVRVWRKAVLDAGAPDNLSIIFARWWQK